MLLVGGRRGALEAARDLGLGVRLVSEKPPPKSLADVVLSHVPCVFPAAEEEWRRIAREAGAAGNVDAVMTATEGAVLAAAFVRDELGLAGLGPDAARRCSDKLLMKQAVRAAGLACAPFVAGGEGVSGESLFAALGLPMVVKPRVGWGGRFSRHIRRREELPEVLDPGWLAESFITGVEMSVESLVVAGEPVFTSFTQYLVPGWANIVPAAVSAATAAELRTLSRAVIRALGIERGMTHVEVFLTSRGVVFGEIAARPPGGHIMELIARVYGFDPWHAWMRSERGEPLGPFAGATRAAGAWILHPGGGRVETIAGVEEARALPGIERVSLRVRPGSEVAERIGVGQEVGTILAVGADRDEVERRLRQAHGSIRIELEGD